MPPAGAETLMTPPDTSQPLCRYDGFWDGKKLRLNFGDIHVKAPLLNIAEARCDLKQELQTAIETSDIPVLLKRLPWVEPGRKVGGLLPPLQTNASDIRGVIRAVVGEFRRHILFLCGGDNYTPQYNERGGPINVPVPAVDPFQPFSSWYGPTTPWGAPMPVPHAAPPGEPVFKETPTEYIHISAPGTWWEEEGKAAIALARAAGKDPWAKREKTTAAPELGKSSQPLPALWKHNPELMDLPKDFDPNDPFKNALEGLQAPFLFYTGFCNGLGDAAIGDFISMKDMADNLLDWVNYEVSGGRFGKEGHDAFEELVQAVGEMLDDMAKEPGKYMGRSAQASRRALRPFRN